MKKLKLKNIIGYSCVNFLGGGAQTLISAWLMYFYTTLCVLSPVQAGLIFSCARLIDGVCNPVMGFISDNFGKTFLGKKFGRRRFFILIGAPLILVIFPILWTTGHPFSFYFILNLVYEAIFTMIIVPSATLPTEMTKVASERSKLIGAQQYVGILASTLSAFIPGRMFLAYGKNSPKSFFLTGLMYAIVISLALLVEYALTFEQKDISYEDSATSIGQIFKKLILDITSSLRIRAFRLHCVMMGLGGIFKQLTSGVFTYYVIFVLMLSSVTTSYISSAATLISAIGLVAYISIAYKKGGPKAFRISTVIVFISLIGYTALALTGHSSYTVVLLTIFAMINTLGRTGIDFVPTYQLTFMADIDEAVTAHRREGIFTGVNSLLSKVAAAVEAAVLGIVLSAFGFKKGVSIQSHSAIMGIMIVTVVVPFVLLAIAWIATVKLKLNTQNHKILVTEIGRLKNGGSMNDATPEVKKVFKELTGWEYEKCWGHNNVGYKNE
ncbi:MULTISPECIES: MFS transporter [Clostridium]|uniref:MFS transporter n=1 Tax=Clostridium TaxID=1485 RepID=UPI000A6805DF|nr:MULTISPECIES: MFS transporter [Clostridium]